MAFKIEESNSATTRCREKGRKRQRSKCRIQLSGNYTVCCAEILQEEILGKRIPNKPPVCDCIVRVSDTKISLIELKGGGPRDSVLEQFDGGVEMLRYVVDVRGPFCLQAVLFTNRKFIDRSEEVVLKTPLAGVMPPVTIFRKRCGDALPDTYVKNCRIA